MARVELRQVSKVFGHTNRVLDNLDLRVEDGEILVLIGPNGSGKTTLLRLIAGLDQVSSGDVWIGGQCVTRSAARHRNVAMVFQSAVLYPHLTVEQNLYFGWRDRVGDAGGGFDESGSSRTNRAETEGFGDRSDERRRQSPQDRVRDMAQRLGIESLLGCLPRHLSGGQRQRVALGRALVRQPAVFLLDEPALNVDPALRQELPVICRRTIEETGGTMILVSHDHSDSLAWADRVAVLQHGRIQQVGSAASLSAAPSSRTVAESLGWSPMHFVDGAWVERQECTSFVCGFGQFDLPPDVWKFMVARERLTNPTVTAEPGLTPPGSSTGSAHSNMKKLLESDDHNDCTGSLNTGSLNTGSLNTGSLNTGSLNTGPINTAPINTAPKNIARSVVDTKFVCLGWRWDGAVASAISSAGTDRTGLTGTVQWLESRGVETIAWIALTATSDAGRFGSGTSGSGTSGSGTGGSGKLGSGTGGSGTSDSVGIVAARVVPESKESPPLRSGAAVQIRVDPTRAFWFDSRTGANLHRT